MTTPDSTRRLPAQPGSSVPAGPAQQMLLAAATTQTCDGAAGFSFRLAEGAR
jgi:hypothetical protein